MIVFIKKQLQLRDEWMITQRNDMYLGKVYSVLDFDCMDLLKIWILVDTFISSIKNYIPCGAYVGAIIPGFWLNCWPLCKNRNYKSWKQAGTFVFYFLNFYIPGGEYGGGFWNCWGGTLPVGTPFSAIVQIKVTMTDSDDFGNSNNCFLIKWYNMTW